MIRRTRAVAAALGLALSLTLTSCAGSSDPPGSQTDQSGCTGDLGTLTLWVDDTREVALANAAAQFKAEQCVTVSLVKKNFDDMRQDFVSQVAAGEGPDITVGANDWLGEFMSNGVVAPIDLTAVESKLAPAAVQAYKSGGQTYGVPYAMENIALVRNNALASETKATTFDQLIAEAKTAGAKYTILLQMGEKGDAYHLYPIQSSFGAAMFETDANGDFTSTLAMGGDPGHQFAQYIAGLGRQGVLSTSITDNVAKQQFMDGQAPYMITGPWNTTGPDSFSETGLDITVLPIPPAGDQPAAPFLGVPGFFFSSRSPNTLLAQLFLVEYVTRLDVQIDLFKAGGRTPASLEAQADPIIAEDPIASGFAAAAANAVVQPSIPAMNSVWAPLGQTEADLVSGAAGDLAPTWDKMIADITAAIADSKP
ncbi:MAG: extracellular solute-binding protein [Bifidobacteriaceae bacterium]|jgi:arabinogalactan oligomer/maltooligosaccharide transport system substrate-binding protein|nr:extracellular solute-binding protein [Bifidobacteriaceae bacterium]